MWQIYSTQDFDIPGFPGVQLTGKTLLDSQYGLTDVNSWGMFGVLLAWVALFRLTFYGVFLFDVYPYLKKAINNNNSNDAKDISVDNV